MKKLEKIKKVKGQLFKKASTSKLFTGLLLIMIPVLFVKFNTSFKNIIPTYYRYVVDNDMFVSLAYFLLISVVLIFNYVVPSFQETYKGKDEFFYKKLVNPLLLMFGLGLLIVVVMPNLIKNTDEDVYVDLKISESTGVLKSLKKGAPKSIPTSLRNKVEDKYVNFNVQNTSIQDLIRKGTYHLLVERVASASGVEINRVDSRGSTALGTAIALGDERAVEILLSNNKIQLEKPSYFVPKNILSYTKSIFVSRKNYIMPPIEIATHEVNRPMFEMLINSKRGKGIDVTKGEVAKMKDSIEKFNKREYHTSYGQKTKRYGKKIVFILLAVGLLSLSGYFIYTFSNITLPYLKLFLTPKVYIPIALVVAGSVGYYFYIKMRESKIGKKRRRKIGTFDRFLGKGKKNKKAI